MSKTLITRIKGLDIEEKILNGAAIAGIVGVFLPWVGGQWLGGLTVSHSGFGFYTSYIGIVIFLLFLTVLLITAVPLIGERNLVSKEQKNPIRVCLSSACALLTLSALSVLVNFTIEFGRMDIRFGVYLCVISSFVMLLYSFLRLQDQKRKTVQDMFHSSSQQ